MSAASWYVVQVETGRELRTCTAIERARISPALLKEYFAPRYRTQFKLHGTWHDEERMLLPGYIVAVTTDPWRLVREFAAVPAFTRIVRAGRTFTPLSDEDRTWIERWTTEGDRIIPMSIARKEGDKIVVTEGPLAGHEAMIRKIRRRQNVAELEIRVGQITIRSTVGLAVLPA